MIFVYDCGDPASFEETRKLIDMIHKNEQDLKRGRKGSQMTFPVKYVLGNKMDLLSYQQLNKSIIADYKAKDIEFEEVSALTFKGVRETFDRIVNTISHRFPTKFELDEPMKQETKQKKEAKSKTKQKTQKNA